MRLLHIAASSVEPNQDRLVFDAVLSALAETGLELSPAVGVGEYFMCAV